MPLVVGVTGAVGKAGEVEPLAGHVLAGAVAGEEPLDEFLERIGRGGGGTTSGSVQVIRAIRSLSSGLPGMIAAWPPRSAVIPHERFELQRFVAAAQGLPVGLRRVMESIP